MPDGTGPGPQAAVRRGAMAGLIAAAVLVTGCGSQRIAAVSPFKVASAYVMQTNGIKSVYAYFVLANSGPADQLIAVHSSAGGKVLMIGQGPAGLSAARSLNELPIPGHSVTKLDPTGMHLEILNSGPLPQGTDITLTLVFAHAAQVKVLAQINNPETGNSGYFGP
jgi:copper(I)-binding protein